MTELERQEQAARYADRIADSLGVVLTGKAHDRFVTLTRQLAEDMYHEGWTAGRWVPDDARRAV